MPRYIAFLRGVSPMNAKMSELKSCFEALGFTDVKTVLSSGNVVFNAAKSKDSVLAERIQAGMAQHLSRSFPLVLRQREHLLELLSADPYAAFDVPAEAKRVVTFLNEPITKEPEIGRAHV